MKSEVSVFALTLLIFVRAEYNVTTVDEEESSTAIALTDIDAVSEEYSTTSQFQEPRGLWISQVFYEARKSFDLDPNVTDECKKSFDSYSLHLHNQTVWAVRMMESSEWPSRGLITGKVTYPGDWDGCQGAHGPDIGSKYCLVQAFLNTSLDARMRPNSSNGTQWAKGDSSAWDTIEMYAADSSRIDRRRISWALCCPSSCSVNDIKISLNRTLKSAFQKYGLDINVNVNPLLCSVPGAYSYPFGFYCACAVFIFITLLVVTSSMYDIFSRTEGETKFWLLKKIFKCFSVRQNYINLTHYKSPASTNPGIYLIKICSFALIVHGNRIFSNLSVPPTSHMEQIEAIYTSMNIFIIGLDVVDVFFMISGFLTFHIGFFPMKKLGVIYLPLSIMFRWFRMMPVFGLLLLFVIQILPFMSEGPWWNYRILPEIETCRRTWVFDLLAIENFIHAHQQCLLISWYLSVDIQLSILGGVLLLIVTKYKKIGMGVIAATFFIFTELVGIRVYKKKYYGVLRLFLNSVSNIREKEEFHNLYTSTVSRVTPYLVGFIAALLTNILKAKRYTFSTRQTTLIPLGLSFIGVASVCHGLVLYNTTRQYNAFENVIYAVLHRTLFVLPVASLLCIYFTSGLGKFNKVFEMKIFVPFGRLIYSAFLVHYVIQLYHVSSQRELPLVPEKINRVYWWISDIVCSYTVAFFVYMMCEGPMYSITKFLQSYLTRRPRRISTHIQENLNASQNGFQNKAYQDDEEVIQEMTPRDEDA